MSGSCRGLSVLKMLNELQRPTGMYIHMLEKLLG